MKRMKLALLRWLLSDVDAGREVQRCVTRYGRAVGAQPPPPRIHEEIMRRGRS